MKDECRSGGVALYSPETLAAMREWIADCYWPDLDASDVATLSDAEVIAGVRKHFDGGIPEFLRCMEVAA